MEGNTTCPPPPRPPPASAAALSAPRIVYQRIRVVYERITDVYGEITTVKPPSECKSCTTFKSVSTIYRPHIQFQLVYGESRATRPLRPPPAWAAASSASICHMYHSQGPSEYTTYTTVKSVSTIYRPHIQFQLVYGESRAARPLRPPPASVAASSAPTVVHQPNRSSVLAIY